MSEELKPCPFCGARPHQGENKVRYCSLHGDPFQDFAIWCPHLCARKVAADKDRAITAWNTRSAADALTAAQEENERLVHDIERLSASLSAEVTGSERLRTALTVARRSIMEGGGVSCTVWAPEDVSLNETLVDHIDAALDGLPR